MAEKAILRGIKHKICIEGMMVLLGLAGEQMWEKAKSLKHSFLNERQILFPLYLAKIDFLSDVFPHFRVA